MQIAICGLGTIGYGVFDIIQKNDLGINVKKVFDKDLSKTSLVGDIITTDLNDILNDKEITLAVCTMGGLDFAYSTITTLMKAGKSVVTANKEVVSKYFKELTELKTKMHVDFSFEASVGGGVPIIKNLIDISRSNEISSIYGILNGTTNFILTRIAEGMDFDSALKEAREKGFAEANASYDLEGLDMLRKIAILTMVAKDEIVDIDKIYHYPMSGVTLGDMEFLKTYNFNIKYVCYLTGHSLGVEPMLINDSFKNVNDEYNIVNVEATNYGNLRFYGKGAGRYATANAIVNDVVDIYNGNKNYTFKGNNSFKIEEDDSEYMYFLRVKDITIIDKTKILAFSGNRLLTTNMKRSDLDFDNIEFYARAK
ncbi:MAG: homoserine dehydrogenase [Bacilli bacterium]